VWGRGPITVFKEVLDHGLWIEEVWDEEGSGSEEGGQEDGCQEGCRQEVGP
jgi:hypothetical protein